MAEQPFTEEDVRRYRVRVAVAIAGADVADHIDVAFVGAIANAAIPALLSALAEDGRLRLAGVPSSEFIDGYNDALNDVEAAVQDLLAVAGNESPANARAVGGALTAGKVLRHIEKLRAPNCALADSESHP